MLPNLVNVINISLYLSIRIYYIANGDCVNADEGVTENWH